MCLIDTFRFFVRDSKNILPVLLAVLLIGCGGTTGKSTKIETADIVITEEFGIDTDLAQKFKQSVELINQKKYEEAIELLVVVTNNTNKHSAPYINLAIAYSESGRIEEAENILLKAVKINPLHPVTKNELALVYRKTGRFSEARQTYEEVIKNYPQFLPARKNLGILCDLFLKDLACAIEHYQVYLGIQSNDKEMKIWLADLKRRAGQ
ncbi:MAG: tetratricopeptide repeat protein [Gammaproteobacteria bacterium]|nr:tetratricopeptide repeat protein [Gammaproteobacteria bacterium]